MTTGTGTPFSLRALAAGVVASAVAFGATPAFSQMLCVKHADVEKRLRDGYQEVRTAVGSSGENGLMEVYTSEKGTFTILLVRPNGLACILAVGENYERLKPVALGDPA